MVDNTALYDAIFQEIGYYDFYDDAVSTFSFEEFNTETNQNIAPVPIDALNFIKSDPQEISRQASFAVQQFVNALDGQQNNIYIQANMQGMKDLLAGPYGAGILAVHAGNIQIKRRMRT